MTPRNTPSIVLLIVLTIPAAWLRAEQKALLIGINSYPGRPLKGPINDVNRFREVLIGHYDFAPDKIKVLLEKEATTGAIVAAFEDHLIQGTKPDDSVVFFFSGHGSHVPDLDGDEEDGRDEVLVTADTDPRNPATWLLDEKLGKLVDLLPTKNALIVHDCCHSGTGLRGGESVQGLKPEEKEFWLAFWKENESRFYELDAALPDESPKEPVKSAAALAPRVATGEVKAVFLSAALAAQEAWETVDTEKRVRHGVLTAALCRELSVRGGSERSFEEVAKAVKESVIGWSANTPGVRRQTPQIEGTQKSLRVKEILGHH